MAISDKAKQITKNIYGAYGTDSGILFGIPAKSESAVEAIVQTTLNYLDSEKEDAEYRSDYPKSEQEYVDNQ